MNRAYRRVRRSSRGFFHLGLEYFDPAHDAALGIFLLDSLEKPQRLGGLAHLPVGKGGVEEDVFPGGWVGGPGQILGHLWIVLDDGLGVRDADDSIQVLAVALKDPTPAFLGKALVFGGHHTEIASLRFGIPRLIIRNQDTVRAECHLNDVLVIHAASFRVGLGLRFFTPDAPSAAWWGDLQGVALRV